VGLHRHVEEKEGDALVALALLIELPDLHLQVLAELGLIGSLHGLHLTLVCQHAHEAIQPLSVWAHDYRCGVN